jgi:hypothetical protein
MNKKPYIKIDTEGFRASLQSKSSGASPVLNTSIPIPNTAVNPEEEPEVPQGIPFGAEYIMPRQEVSNTELEQIMPIDNNIAPQMQYGGPVYKMANGGPTNPPIYVDSRNDQRYKAYNDSLALYNRSEEKLKYWRNNPNATNVELNIMEDRIDREIPVSRSRDSFGSNFIAAIDMIPIGTRNSLRNVPIYQKPTQPVKIKPKETITPTYEKFKETLPDNLRNTDESDYNMRGYWEALGKPASFDYSQPKEDDGYYHAFSRNPNTGEILKKPQHPTFRMALEDDINAGYIPYQSPDGKIFTFGTNDTIPENYSRYTLPQQNNYSNSGLHYSVGVDKGKIVYRAGSIGNMKTMTPQQFEEFKKTDEFKKYNEVRKNDTPSLEQQLTVPQAGYIKMMYGGTIKNKKY